MVLLLIVVNAVILLALAALWESWRAARRSLAVAPEGDLTIRLRSRPADAALVGALIERAGWPPQATAPPVWGDRSTLIEGPEDQMATLLTRLVESALDDGFHVTAQDPSQVTLRRRLRRLIVEVSRA